MATLELEIESIEEAKGLYTLDTTVTKRFSLQEAVGSMGTASTDLNSSNGGTVQVRGIDTVESLPFIIPFQPAGRPKAPQFRALEIEWLKDHQEELSRLRGNWVALEDDSVVAYGPDCRLVVRKARDKGISIPFVFFIPPEEDGFAGI